MNKKRLIKSTMLLIMCFALSLSLLGCDFVNNLGTNFKESLSNVPGLGNLVNKGEKEQQPEEKPEETVDPVGTLSEKGYEPFAEDEKPMDEFVTLDKIYFPKGFLDTEFGLFIYDAEATKKQGGEDVYYRTDTPEGKAIFDINKPTFISIHGMGWNSMADDAENYADQFNVLAFQWGAICDENNSKVTLIASKVWLCAGFNWQEEGVFYQGARWENEAGEWEYNDVINYSTAEIFCAYYYDLFQAFPDYAGSLIHIFGHSYGANLSMAATSLLTTAFRCGYIPAYMLPDECTLLDPFISALFPGTDIPWLQGIYNADGNLPWVLCYTADVCHELGISIRMFRISRMISSIAALEGSGVDVEYWDFMNKIVYAHIEGTDQNLFADPSSQMHNYGWDWFTEYYTGADAMLYDIAPSLADPSSTLKEPVLCMNMPYANSFARAGVKYNIGLNGTLDTVDDDQVMSFYMTYVTGNNTVTWQNDLAGSESTEVMLANHGKSKVAGFVYYDRNENGEFDERVGDHIQGVTVTVTDKDGNVIYTNVTGTNGYYEIDVDQLGDYTVTITVPEGYTLTSGEATQTVTVVDPSYQIAFSHFGLKK